MKKMQVNNSDFGGFIVSKNILNNHNVRYSFREKSSKQDLNGWTLYSIIDDDEYISDFKNFSIVNAQTLFELVPVMFEIFNAPYGTDLFWKYENNTHVGFYDLTKEKDIDIVDIMLGE